MTTERWNELSDNIELGLNEDEINEGWHFCHEFDGLLVLGDPKKPICGRTCIDWDGRLSHGEVCNTATT